MVIREAEEEAEEVEEEERPREDPNHHRVDRHPMGSDEKKTGWGGME